MTFLCFKTKYRRNANLICLNCLTGAISRRKNRFLFVFCPECWALLTWTCNMKQQKWTLTLSLCPTRYLCDTMTVPI